MTASKKTAAADTSKSAEKRRLMDVSDLPTDLRPLVQLRNGMTAEQIDAAVRVVAEANGVK